MRNFNFLTILSLFVATMGFSQELVTNGDFETGDGSGGWVGNALNVVDLDGNYVNQSNVENAGNPWDVNLSYVLPLTEGVTYELNFDAWTDSNTGSRIMTAGIGLNQDPWTNINDPAVALTDTPQTFTYTWVCPATSETSRIIFDLGNDVGFVFIDNVSLVEVTAAEPTCDDGIQNGDETGVDCGGSCEPCETPGGPETAAPTPPARPASDVVSIYSDAYASVGDVSWGPDWGPASARINDLEIEGNPTKVIEMGNGQVFTGISFIPSTFDATDFTHFHMDYWVAEPLSTGQALSIKLSNHDGGAGETSAIQTLPTPQAGQWVSLDIPLADFVAASAPENLSRNAIAEIVITAARADGAIPVNLFFDNLYFHKNTLGVNDLSQVKAVKLYPNPVKAGQIVALSTDVETVEVFSTTGKRVKAVRTDSFSTAGLSEGVYFLRIKTTEGKVQTQKLIVK